MTKKHIFYFLFIIVVLFIQSEVYHYINLVDLNADTNLINRKIETPIKLFLNGYLSLFFGFNYLGNINFLIIPLSILYYYLFKPVLNKGQLFLIVFFILSFGLISVKGFFNPRYSLTLLPFTVFFVFYFTHKIVSKFYSTFFLYVSYTLLFSFACYNFYVLVLASQFERKVETILQTPHKQEIKKDNAEIENVLKYIDTMKTEAFFLVNNLPDFYYLTNKKGKYFWCGDDLYFGPKGKMNVFTDAKSNISVHEKIKNELKCDYIYTSKHYEKYSDLFDEFITKYCTLIASDSEGKLLYKINEI